MRPKPPEGLPPSFPLLRRLPDTWDFETGTALLRSFYGPWVKLPRGGARVSVLVLELLMERDYALYSQRPIRGETPIQYRGAANRAGRLTSELPKTRYFLRRLRNSYGGAEPWRSLRKVAHPSPWLEVPRLTVLAATRIYRIYRVRKEAATVRGFSCAPHRLHRSDWVADDLSAVRYMLQAIPAYYPAYEHAADLLPWLLRARAKVTPETMENARNAVRSLVIPQPHARGNG